jgi:hypothetical protein
MTRSSFLREFPHCLREQTHLSAPCKPGGLRAAGDHRPPTRWSPSARPSTRPSPRSRSRRGGPRKHPAQARPRGRSPALQQREPRPRFSSRGSYVVGNGGSDGARALVLDPSKSGLAGNLSQETRAARRTGRANKQRDDPLPFLVAGPGGSGSDLAGTTRDLRVARYSRVRTGRGLPPRTPAELGRPRLQVPTMLPTLQPDHWSLCIRRQPNGPLHLWPRSAGAGS